MQTTTRHEEKDMTHFTVTAEHGNGKSVGHPCRHGVYSDPTDSFEMSVEASDENDAISIATRELEKRVKSWPACDCRRQCQPGSNDWWDSVSIIAEEEKDVTTTNTPIDAAIAEGMKFFWAAMHCGHTVTFIGHMWDEGGFGIDSSGNPITDFYGNTVAKFAVEDLDRGNPKHVAQAAEWWGGNNNGPTT